MQNEAIDVLLRRRSIRRYDAARPVERDMAMKLLECACAAPTAAGRRPWHFILVEDRKLLDALAAAHPYAKMLGTAPLAILVCGETERDGTPLRWWEEDCSAAMENILLAAEALGLGSVWLGVRHGAGGLEDKIKDIFGVPVSAAVLGIAAIGWPDETKDPHSGVDPCCLHVNRW